MTGVNDEQVQYGPNVAAVLHSALDLLASVPERPERLKVTAADVTVELDWRVPVARVEAVVPASMPVAAVPAAVPAATPAMHVCAPTVGTFYHAPEPGAAPFVTVGSVVSVGQQVGIVEAMKLMLPVEADRAGRVVEILAENGASVEYGQRLLALEPAG